MNEITELLKAWSAGALTALDQLLPLVEPELKRIAHGYMRDERPGTMLQTTALVNEALMKLLNENINWENRKQFYAFTARRMRQVLVDYAKRQRATKRGNWAEQVDIDEAAMRSSERSKELLELEDALMELGRIDQRKVTVVECRFFIGLTIEETAKIVGASPTTVEREWRFARAWLKQQMTCR
jgi:RNA polymerase sigma-70 factor (ECF subfamily)